MNNDSATIMRELKELLNFGFDLQDAIAKSLEDGKIGSEDFPSFFPLVTSAWPAFTGLSNPINMWRELTETERDELIAFAKARFDLENDMLEMLIEDTIDRLTGLIRVATRWARFFQKRKEENTTT